MAQPTAAINYPLEVTASGDFAMAAGSRRLEQSIRLILATYPGERPMRQDFGSRLRDFVFELCTSDNAAALAGEVRRAVAKWEPRVELTKVRVVQDTSVPGLVHLDVEYRVVATDEVRELTVPFHFNPDSDGS
ncbi:hypothetical protein ALI144C_19650 [Actinosynnema sp. ALI-1.44]|uniref:GPW/gp25 family protein n=1 Tax=Actinosynnema sp. ALI-1.44 TaxID=1933779 RepID=UPI00097BD3C6|nr:GPW/gp25 family protein [Actinosynnema sp. ALI-1.44]ONI81531.1 hypothetical protein ALI144C_19650 [Actinosynnema sp. ALI-1.44]